MAQPLPKGNGPPLTISPGDLYAEMAQLPRPHRLVDYPRQRPDGTCGQVAIMPLNSREQWAATTETERFVRKMLKEVGLGVPSASERSEGYTTLFEARASAEILWRAAKRADNLAVAFFPTVDSIGELTVDEQGVLFRQYINVCGEVGPIISKMSTEEMNAWIERLAIGGRSDPLAFLTAGLRNDLVMYMASRLYPSPMDSSSSGEQPEESGSETS